MCQAFDRLEAIDPIVRGLRFALPWPQAEDALHRVKRGVRRNGHSVVARLWRQPLPGLSLNPPRE